MKNKSLSIKNRITLYYAITMIFIVVIIFAVLFFTTERQVQLVSENTIMTAVQDSFEEIQCEDNVIVINSDFDIYKKGVTLLIYGEQGNLIKGNLPEGFPEGVPLESESFHKIEGNNEMWTVYDIYSTYENGESIYVRGIYAMNNTLETTKKVTMGILILIPLLILIAVLVGKKITEEAFSPIKEINRAACEIGNGADFSKRLPQGKNHDELYDLTETLNHMIEKLENAYVSEKEFTNDVSHELKTPVSVILAECEYALKGEKTKEEYVESITEIQKKCRKQMTLINQLLQISRTLDSESSLNKEIIDLSSLCNITAEEMRTMAEEKNISVITDIEDNVSLEADETLIMRLLINLINNSIKYRRTVDNSFIKISLKKKDNIILSVEDNGIGISEENLSHIFNRFFKVDKSRESSEESFGLGLSMVKWIVDAHHGTISVESKEGQGTRFTIEL